MPISGSPNVGASVPPPRVPKSEHDPARTEVDEVGPGVLRMQLPIQLPGLMHINTYALIDRDGVTIVDPGMPGPRSWRDLKDRLAKADIPVRRVKSIVITHSHPDHFGNAGRLAEQCGAEVITHRSFRTFWSAAHQCTLDDCDDPVHCHYEPGAPSLPPGGGEKFGSKLPWSNEIWNPKVKIPLSRGMLQKIGLGVVAQKLLRPPKPSRRVRNGEVLTLAGREWLAIHTPGHTLDHLCLYDPEGGIFISGDHVLPGITPHVGGLNNGADPMRWFFSSLRTVGALPGVNTVLPAHGKVFHDLRGRTEEILDHHHERLDRLRDALTAEGASTVEAMSHHLFRKERWGHMAQSETYTHLEYLLSEAEVTRTDDNGLSRYELVR